MERKLNTKEYELLKYLLDFVEDYDFGIDNIKVVDMKDGGMGSLLFVSSNHKKNRKMSESIIEKQFNDADGVPISVCVNIDEEKKLFELDIWRVDFNPVIRFPSRINVL